MSYILELRLSHAGAGPHHHVGLEQDDGTFVALDAAKEALKLRIADALVARYPALEVSREGYGRGDPARLRCLEINDLGDDSFGVQVQLFDDGALVSVPFWHQGDKAAACFAQVWDFMRIVCEEGGYTAFDRQLNRPLENGESPDAAREAYIKAFKRISRDPELGGRKPPKPKWKK